MKIGGAAGIEPTSSASNANKGIVAASTQLLILRFFYTLDNSESEKKFYINVKHLKLPVKLTILPRNIEIIIFLEWRKLIKYIENGSAISQ